MAKSLCELPWDNSNSTTFHRWIKVEPNSDSTIKRQRERKYTSSDMSWLVSFRFSCKRGKRVDQVPANSTMSTKSNTIASNNYLKDLYLKQRLRGDFTLSRICWACFGKNEAHWAMITSIETCKKSNIKFSRTWIKRKKKKKKFLALFPYEF